MAAVQTPAPVQAGADSLPANITPKQVQEVYAVSRLPLRVYSCTLLPLFEIYHTIWSIFG